MSIIKKEPNDNTDSKWIPDSFEYANVKDVLDTTYKLELEARNALSFDGNDDYIDVSHSDIDVPWTFSAQVKVTDNGQSSQILANGSTSSLRLEQYSNTNKIGFTILGVGDYTFSTSSPFDNSWHHIVFVATSTGIKLYLDGSLSDTRSETPKCPLTNIGGRSGSSYSVKGLLSDIRVYHRELSSTEVGDLYNGNPVSDTNLVGHWKLDEGTGTTANDSSGNNNDGTITGATWNGASYKDYPPHYGNGYRVSEPLSLDSIKKVKNSNIKWTSTEPTSTDIKIYTAISSSNTTEPNTEEKQTLYLGGATGGTFTLGDGTTNTSALAYDASASTIQTALEGIYGSGLVSVVEDTDFTITFDISIGDSNLEASFTNLTGATDPTLTVSDAVDYKKATSNSTIPGISTDQDLTGKYLWIRQKLSTTIDDTPTLSTLDVLIETAKKSLAFFKFF